MRSPGEPDEESERHVEPSEPFDVFYCAHCLERRFEPRRQVKAAAISDAAMIEVVLRCADGECNYPMEAGYHGGRPGYGYGKEEPHGHWAGRWDIERYDFPDVPPKVVLAKLRSLIKRGLIDGCACGCRGDFEAASCELAPRRREQAAAAQVVAREQLTARGIWLPQPGY